MKTYSVAYLIGVATFSLSLTIACGSSAQHTDAAVTSGTCGRVQPCGGDLLGTWTLTETCTDIATQPPLTCPDERIASWTPTLTGNWTFNADLTYSRSTTSSAVVVWNIPLSCISALAASCADFEAQVQATLDPGQTIACTGTTTCVCTETAAPSGQTDNGTYQVTGSNVALTSAVTGTTGTGSYCVQDGRLHIVTLNAGAANGIGSDIVGEKP
jgi:hypothetical protein